MPIAKAFPLCQQKGASFFDDLPRKARIREPAASYPRCVSSGKHASMGPAMRKPGKPDTEMSERAEETLPKIKLFGRDFALPRSRPLRVGVGTVLVLFGTVGFLPVVGFWMVPLGLFVLAHDSPRVRRFNRRAGIWIRRRMQKMRS
ncbi:MAG: hypothetical protein Q8Q62_03710 [Mesorhizobium sp.]|nr:hypothetical protein [Mesorhizobium sp.]